MSPCWKISEFPLSEPSNQGSSDSLVALKEHPCLQYFPSIKRLVAAYQDFLTLWKDADPDIPILKQAKAEYAKLE